MSTYGGFERGGHRRWQRLSEVDAHEHIAAFEAAHQSGETLSAYCKRVGIQRQALAEAVRTYIPERADDLIGAPGDPQKRGTKFENSVKGMLKTRGYYAIRQYASHSPFDLLAVGLGKPPLMVQAKKDGKLFFAEWNALFDLATEYGCWPVLARRPLGEDRGALWFRLAGRKEKKGQRNEGLLVPFDPRDPEQESLLAPAVAG